MKLIKQLEAHRNHTIAQTITYKDVSFPHGFMPFLEALYRDRLIPANSRRQTKNNRQRWAEGVSEGLLMVETAQHPLVHQNDAGDMIVSGSIDLLERFDALVQLYEVDYEGATKPEDIELKHQYHDELNPEVWEGKAMKEEVRSQLLKIAETFVDFLKIDDLNVEDIILTGSSANYNWTDASDLDVHVLVDFEDAIAKHGDLIEEYFNAKKNVFNNLHNITIHGNTVEMYVQDSNEQHHSTGVFSLQNNKWETEPQHKEPDVDDNAVRAKAAELMNEIDAVAKGCYKAAPVEALMEKLKKMRQAGLDEAGEFSVENLVFKQLRHNGYLEKLSTCKTRSFDRELSIEEEEWSHLC